jgi:peptide/nickel transport system permease protein
MREKNRRKSSALFLTAAVLILAAVTVAGILLEGEAVETDFTRKNLPPSASWLFGTDWMGRDMLARTLAGLSLSIRIGVLTGFDSWNRRSHVGKESRRGDFLVY